MNLLPNRPRVRVALEILAIVLLFVGVRAWQSRAVARGSAPRIVASDLGGEIVTLGGTRAQPSVVYFFATWCGVCRAAEHNLAALARRGEVLAVASQSDEAAAVRRYAAAHGLQGVRIVPDPSGAMAARYGVRAFPTAFYLDANGGIRTVEIGFTSEMGMRARLWFAGLGARH